ncbi:alpha/beta fold hydrolase [Caenimonas soli]|uniref:alpha/beta fold hydrolase n=1 Tax=Caenimonas soli TaxID=2735555 RepID=UPI001554CD9A|nr:alpha/beta hydrolase [Caenimonas soli]NPC58290.1 alpha/beta hydrolase [Caenimonas soli]
MLTQEESTAMQIDSLIHRVRQGVVAARADGEMAAALVGVPCGIRLVVHHGDPGQAITVHEQASGNWLSLVAQPEHWIRFLQPRPDFGWHSFNAARRQGILTVDCDELWIAQCLHALERLFEILRGQLDTSEAAHLDLTGIVGRYVSVPLSDGDRTIHVEFAGNTDAPALVMLHTAGADSRQFHAVMADPELCMQWHMIAFDMPGHGRSDMAPDAWIGYRLSRERYLNVVSGVLETLTAGRKAVLLGCSMGAAMALHGARQLPHLVHGAVALEAPFRSPGRRTAHLAHAQVNQAAHNSSYVRGLMGPGSPLADRRRAAWIYSQGGFGTYAGDLWFYSDDFDAERDVAGLDGTRLPVELLTGTYDFSATPADSIRVAALVPGAEFREMQELGHFPMTENPRLFLDYLQPCLARISARLHTPSP